MSSPLVSRSSSLSWSSAQATRSVCASTSPLLRRSISSTSSGTSFSRSASSMSSRESVAAICDRASNLDASINCALLLTSPIPPPFIEAPVNQHKTCRTHPIFPPGYGGCNGAVWGKALICRVAALVPLAPGKAAKRYEPDEGDDDAEQQAPNDCNHDADDDENPAKADAADAAAAPSSINRHSCAPFRRYSVRRLATCVPALRRPGNARPTLSQATHSTTTVPSSSSGSRQQSVTACRIAIEAPQAPGA